MNYAVHAIYLHCSRIVGLPVYLYFGFVLSCYWFMSCFVFLINNGFSAAYEETGGFFMTEEWEFYFPSNVLL